MSNCANRTVCRLLLVLLLAAPVFAAGRPVTSKVEPVYPELARQMQLAGTVRVQVVVAPDGTVKDTEILGGNPVLAKAAVDAVRRWHFQPGKDETKDVIEIGFALHR